MSRRAVCVIDIDDLWPRDAAHRYRLYARRGQHLHVLAATDSMAGIGTAIGALHEDAKQAGSRLMDEGATGILDAVAGEWIVLPWHRPGAA